MNEENDRLQESSPQHGIRTNSIPDAEPGSGLELDRDLPTPQMQVAEHLLSALEMLLGDQEVTGTSGGGAVQVALAFDIESGSNPITGVRVDPELLQPARAANIAAMLTEAVNAAQSQALQIAEEAISDAIAPDEGEEETEFDRELIALTESMAATTQATRNALTDTLVAGQAAGGAVRIIMSAAGDVRSTYLRLDMVRPERAEELEAAFIEAYTDAVEQAQVRWQETITTANGTAAEES